jgi:NAD(P)-dependent dehydrogenase (short-subunit alcohol dehydrogenase family)
MPASQPHVGITIVTCAGGEMRASADGLLIYGRDGLRANAIAPGHIMTPLVERFVSPEAREARRRIAPLEVEGDAWDVAQAALFLAGPEARFISGACLPVDGGVTQVAALAAYDRLMEAPRQAGHLS